MPSSALRWPTASAMRWLAVDDRLAQRAEQVADAAVLVQGLERADDDLAGDLAGRVAAHAVGDREQPGPGVHRVLVVACAPGRGPSAPRSAG